MRKVLGKIFLLCLACVLCTQGLCFAENWVQYGYNNRGVVPGTLLVDVDSVHTVDCKGRRFLQARSKEVFTGAYANAGTISIIAFDLENNLSLQIECRGAATGHLMVKHDISVLASGKVTTSSNGKKEIYDPANRMYVPVDVDNKMLQIIKQYRPDVVQAVLNYNGGSGKTPANIGNIQPHVEYTVLDSGAVCLYEMEMDDGEIVYEYLYRVPKSLGFPMAFATGYRTDGTTTVRTVVENEDRYDYDPSTNTLTVCNAYQWDGAVYSSLYHVVDNNTIHQEPLMGDFIYAGEKKAPRKKDLFGTILWRFDGQQWIGTDSEDGSTDSVPLVWNPGEPAVWHDMEIALLFASLHGNIGELPEEYEIEPQAFFRWQ